MAETSLDPGALTGVLSEAKALETGDHGIETPLGRDSPLLEFVQLAFDQVFRSELGVGIANFSQAEKEEVVLLAEKKSGGPAVEGLLNLYVDVCNLWPDVLSFAYGGTSTDFLEFRTDLVPSLLGELDQLASAKNEEQLAETVKGAISTYSDAIAKASRRPRGTNG
jgi:hypothetical protein